MTKVVVTTSVKDYVTRERDPNDDWDIGDVDGHVDNVSGAIVDELQTYYGCSLGKEFPDHVKVGTRLYAVVADYTSGCTFGRTGAQGQVLDAFETVEEAMALATVAKAVENDYSFDHNGHTYRADWVGYFEHLQNLDVWEIILGQHFDHRDSGISIKRGR